MSANAWPEADGSSQPSQSDHQEHIDRKMIQHLLGRYGQRELSKLIRDEVGTQSDGASIVSSAAPSTVLSDDASSIWDTQSVRTFSSDTSSITGSIISNVSRGAKFLTRRSTSSNHSNSATASAHSEPPSSQDPVSTEANQETLATQSWNGINVASQGNSALDAASTTSGASKQKGTFMCGFCKEEDITKTCTRKNDLKRHIEDFHNVNAQWFCRHRGCKMVYDWQAAYKAHLKTAHGGSRMSLDEAKVNLCPQVVFACGFENCFQVYEAQGDADANSVFKEYVSHLVKHFDEGSNSGEWSYSARIRNLLRQSQVAAAWNESIGWNENATPELQWNPQTSDILRKRLESRHVGDVKLLIQCAHALGREPQAHRKFREDFATPVVDACQEPVPGHKNGHHQSMTPPQPQLQAQPADQFSFRISRGANPALAQYMASQRKVYVPSRQRSMRPPQLHRASSSAMGTHHHMPQTPHDASTPLQQQHRGSLGHFFTSAAELQSQSPMYHDPNSNNSGHAQFSPGNSTMHQNGIIADDLQSLRSMTGETPEPVDVDMHDSAGMMDFSSPYPNYGMQSPAVPIESHPGFQ